MSLELVRKVADAVLYEGYLLYPYRATSGKNQVRWQFGVLGPIGAARAGTGEDSQLSMQCLLRAAPDQDPPAAFDLHIRFLQVQRRTAQAPDQGRAGFVDVPELRIDDQRWFSWDEAVEVERAHRVGLEELIDGCSWSVIAQAGQDSEDLVDGAGGVAGRLVRQRWALRASACARVEQLHGLYRLSVSVDNEVSADGLSKDDVLQRSLVGTHIIVESLDPGPRFVSVIDPPNDAVEAAAACHQHRCWPVLAGPEGATNLVLGSPIILYDHPEVAAESAGALFDSTEIDEILTLRIMTMTDEEKAEATATDPRAREIIERCDQMSPSELQNLHGILRDPHAGAAALADESIIPEAFVDAVAVAESDADRPWFDTSDVPWWDPAADERVQPELDAVLINGIRVSKGSLVRVHPSRRADAQDLFFADQLARVTAVLSDVDGGSHVAVVLIDDPAAELHDWYGRYLYFASDELEPLIDESAPGQIASRQGQAGEERRI